MNVKMALETVGSLSRDLQTIRNNSVFNYKYDQADAWLDTVEGIIGHLFSSEYQLRDMLLARLNSIMFYDADNDDTTKEEDWSEGMAKSESLIRAIQYHLELLDNQEVAVGNETNRKSPPLLSTDFDTNRVFIVHGHDENMSLKVSDFLRRLRLDPIILSEEANGGFKSVMEKFEEHAESARFAIVLLSPDDYGYSKRDGQSGRKPRARQNVILELGYFIGRLGRDNVIAFTKPDTTNESIEQPSDIVGGIIERFDDNWKERIRTELRNAGYELSR